ncbi:hypothetical protein BC938DRAFT_475665 [Jimgerdemannia flammicorona]|uniref:SP-RING-type domain-containing protein n=1 Tax=Jimgerdemannia flammicorona TaxID=994334 RepID=A0A433PQL4_9FUNG|nr:hypothetical protein BC938DRAFT_475665 [Jimgerdemannia flammicorona]
MRIADLKTIGNYLAEKKLFLGKLYGKKKEVQLKILKSIIWPNLVAQNPIASLPIPSVPPTAFQLSSFYAQIAPLGFLRRERELVAQTLQSGMNIPQAIVVPYTVRVALSHLLPLLEGESDVVKHQDKRNRAHLYLFSTTFGRVLDAKSYEVNAGFQHIDITKCLNWGAIIEYQRRHEDSSVTDVLLHLEIPKRVFTQGYLALWKVRKLGVKEYAMKTRYHHLVASASSNLTRLLVAKVYLDTMNAYLDEEDPKAEEEVDEVALETMRRQSEAANEDLVARVERMFVSRVADTEGTKKDREREKGELGYSCSKKDQTGANDEGEIEMGDQTVSFLDPFVLSRIRHPARGKECKHRACFDLEVGVFFDAFLRFNERKANWQCACCSRMVTVEVSWVEEAGVMEVDCSFITSLIIDTKFKNYLNTYPNADRCIVHSDGTTSVPATNASLSSSTTSSTSSSSSPSRNSTPLSSDCATDAAAAAAAAAPARSSRKRKIGQIEVISLDDSEDEDAVRERRAREKWRSVGARRASPAKLPGVKDVVIVLDD